MAFLKIPLFLPGIELPFPPPTKKKKKMNKIFTVDIWVVVINAVKICDRLNENWTSY